MLIEIERGGRFITIECKLSENPGQTSLKGINALKRFYGDENIIAGYIASKTRHAYSLAEKIYAVPGSLIDQYISKF